MDKPDMSNCSDKEFEKWYWSDYNKVCLKCENKCKQSHIVSLVSCPNRKIKKGEVDDLEVAEEISGDSADNIDV